MNVKVGDEVIVVRARYHRSAENETYPGIVTKVGRKYFYVDTGHWWDAKKGYSLESGRENAEGNYPDYAYTPEAYAEKQRRILATAKLTEFGITFNYRGAYATADRLPIGKMERIVAILGEPDV